jgi:sugar/nucleoside kinase (ribokinase family)
MPRLVSVGNVVVDLLAQLPTLPRSGDDVTATGAGISAGGSFNTLIAARRQGLEAVYAGAHGDGPLGAFVRESLAGEGIDVVQPPIRGRDTGWDVAIVEGGGQRTFITTVGAEADLDGPALARVELRAGDVLHVSGYSFAREPSGRALAEWVPRVPAEVVVIVDPGPLGAAVPEAVRARADWWSAAEGEAAGVGASIVRLGAAGCLLRVPGADEQRIPGFAVDAIDTNGAGDTHVGVFAAAIASGATPADAARRANAAAAIAVTRRGPASAPTSAELDAFIASAQAT